MKGLACGECGDFRALNQSNWVYCACGNVRGRWIDSNLGTAEYDAGIKESAWAIGLNNHFLGPALRGEIASFADARSFHDQATHAPHHIFDKSRAGCWAVIFKPGYTNDTSWYVRDVPAPQDDDGA